jgi:CRISPR-associated protein Csd1
MLLTDLTALHDRLIAEDRLTPTGYALKPVRFLVGLDNDGTCTSIDDTGPDASVRAVPDIRRSGQKPPPFLACDNGQYVLGLPKTTAGKDADHARAVHQSYVQRLQEAADALQSSDPAAAAALRAIAVFTTDTDHARAQFEARCQVTFTPNDKGLIREASDRIGFRVDGKDPLELPSVREWWAGIANADLSAGIKVVCQVSGTTGDLARKMPGLSVKKGTPQALISANFDAAERYNASQSTGAQVGVAVAVGSHQALNWLLGDVHHHRLIGEITYVWWLDGDLDFDPVNLIAHPTDTDVEAVLERPWTGRPGVSPDEVFRLLGLSLTEGRIVIRLNHMSTLAEVDRRTRRWLDLIAQHRSDGKRWWPSIPKLAEAAVAPGTGSARKAQKDRVIEALTATAITGAPLPRSLLAAVIGRCRAVPIPHTADGNGIDWTALGSRLALLNLYRHLKEDTVADTDTDTAAALCGRLLAQLDHAQDRALGSTNRSVVDRYYAAASTRPQSVFPGLLRTTNAHLSKIGRQHGKGAEIAISRRIGELSHQLHAAGGYPVSLGLPGQADFALAYWDERHRRFNRAPTDSDSTPTDSDDTPTTQEDTQ